jgi:hypothetical protein
MSCPTVIRVTTQSGPPGIGLPAGVGDAGKIVQKVGNDPYAYGLVVPGAASLPQALDSAASPTFAGLTISGLPANRLVFTGTGGVFSGLSLGSGLSIVGGALVATGGSTDLGYNPATRVLSSSTGAGVTLPLAGATEAGLQTPEHRELARKLLAAGVAVTAANAVVIPHIHGDIAGALYFHVKNVSGGPLTRGTPVTAGDSVGDTDVLQIVATDPATPGAEHANGVLRDDLPHNGEGHAIIAGELLGVSTAAYSRGPLWVAGGGGLTSTRPASRAQQVATLGRQHAVNGSLLVAVQGVEPTATELGAATAAQGALAATAVQPAALTTALAGKADLVNGFVPTSQIPAIAISDYLGSAASEAAMLALTGQRGDWCLRSDTGAVGQWILSGDNAAVLGNWVRITAPVSPVQSVNGQLGAVVLGAGDVGAQPLDGDLTAIAELPTTTFGRGLLTLLDDAAARTAIGAGTAATLDHGTSPGNVVRLDPATGRLPAVDASELLNVPSGGTPGGSPGQLQFNSGGAFAGVVGSSVDANGNITIASRWTTTNAGGASAPGLTLAGGWFSGGTSATTKPYLLLEPAGTASTGWPTAGTGLGINSPAGFTGWPLAVHQNGSLRWGFDIANKRTYLYTDGTRGDAYFDRGGASGDSRLVFLNSSFSFTITGLSGPVGSGTFRADSTTTDTTATSSTLSAFGIRTVAISGEARVFEGGARSNFDAAPIDLVLRNVARGTAPSGTPANPSGGNVRIVGGEAFSNATNAANGGNVLIDGGVAYGTGAAGNVILCGTRGLVQDAGTRLVAQLPTASLAVRGTNAIVTDASSPIIGLAVAGGGSSVARVWCNGTAWTVTGV